MTFLDINNELMTCRRCKRLVEWRERVAREKRFAFRNCEYWGKPVPGFGDQLAHVFAIGLAPGAHGSNRTGRQFTGDASGDFLYPALYRAGFASQPNSVSRDDGLILHDLYISPICRCVPPGNKPSLEEMKNCQSYLESELKIIQPKVIVALGRMAFDGLKRVFSIQDRLISFAHHAIYQLPSNAWVVCSYHPSRQNTQTGRLTLKMFDQVWETVKGLLQRGMYYPHLY